MVFNKNIKNVLTSKNLFTYFFAAAIVLVGAVLVFYYSSKKVETLLVDQIQRRAELSVSSGAKSMDLFLDTAERSLVLLSNDPSMTGQNPSNQEAFDSFAQKWKDTPILGAVLFDKNDTPLFASKTIGTPSEILGNLTNSDRAFLNEIKNAADGEILLGKPLLLISGRSEPIYILPLATPIYRSGVYNGALGIVISLPKLTETYLDPLNVTPDSRVYLIHKDGTILAAPLQTPDLVGLNYFDFIEKNPYKGSEDTLKQLKTAVNSSEGGSTKLVLFSNAEDRLVNYAIAYYPIFFHDRHWTLSVNVPISGMENINPDFLKESRIWVLSIFVFVSMTAVTATIFIIKNKK